MRVWRVTLTVQGPILSRSTAIGDFGVDAPVFRSADGRPAIAGSHVRGKLRQAVEELEAAEKEARDDNKARLPGSPLLPGVKRLFGKEAAGSKDDHSPLEVGGGRGLIHVGDFHADESGEKEATRTRIAIDANSGCADDGAFQTLETPYGSGAPVRFAGRLIALVDGEQADEIANVLRRAFLWIPQLGGARTIGFGRLLDVTMEDANRPVPALPAAVNPAGERVGVALRLLEPFCIAVAPTEQNLYVGGSVIPGGVIKGALANQLRAELKSRDWSGKSLDDDLAEPHLRTLRLWFDRLRFTHALPSPAEKATRPRRWPLSLAFSRSGRVLDAALLPTDDVPVAEDHAVLFAPDWKGKHYAEVDEAFGWSEPATQLRLRTAIASDRRSADPERLFAYEVVVPDRHVWLGDIDLADVVAEDRAVVLQELLDLTRGLVCGVGKTDAPAEMEFGAPVRPAMAENERPLKPIDGDTYVLTLQTAALLCTGEDLLPKGKFTPAADRLRGAYAETFLKLSAQRLELVTYFARQRLAGGEFLMHRYQKGRRHHYQPWLLTEPGSVFVLKLRKRTERKAAEETLRDWLRRGLPLPASVRRELRAKGGEDDAALWDRCPFIRQNGYGEVEINLDDHLTRRMPALKAREPAAS